MRRFFSFSLSVWALLLAGGGCSWISAPSGGKESVLLSREDGRILEGARLLRQGKPSRALALGERILRVRPWDVEAHRLRQNAMREWFRSGPALLEYTRLAREHPNRPEAWYLLGRISFPLRRQITLFRKALSLNPRFPRAWGGLGWTLLTAGDGAGAEKAFARALALDPGQADYHLGMARALFRKTRGTIPVGREHLRIAARLRPMDPSPLLWIARIEGGAWSLLPRARAVTLEPGSPMVFQDLGNLLENLDSRSEAFYMGLLEREKPFLCAHGLLLLARLRARAGEGREALELFGEAKRRGAFLEEKDRVLAATLLFGAGRWREGLAKLLRWRPRSFPLVGRTGLARLALEKGAARKERLPEDLLVPLAEAGWVRPARALAGWLRSRGRLVSREGRTALERGEEVLYLEKILAAAMGLPGSNTLGGLLKTLARTTRELLGRDVVGKPRLVSVVGIGTYLDPMGPGLPAFFRERGRLLLLGRRVGRRVQALSGRIVTSGRERLTLRGGPSREVTFWLVDGAGLRPSGGPFDLAGLALDHFYMIDLEAIRRWAFQLRNSSRKAREAGALDQPPAPPEGPEGIFTPSDLAAKCRVVGVERPGPSLEERLFEIVRFHELGHLADAAWFLPPGRHLGRVARLLIRCGLWPDRVQAELERRAQAYALARTRWPFLALAQTAGALPVGADLRGESHEVGYALLVRDLARRAVPFLPAGAANPTASLFRLHAEELTAAARSVLDDMGLAAFRVERLR